MDIITEWPAVNPNEVLRRNCKRLNAFLRTALDKAQKEGKVLKALEIQRMLIPEILLP